MLPPADLSSPTCGSIELADLSPPADHIGVRPSLPTHLAQPIDVTRPSIPKRVTLLIGDKIRSGSLYLIDHEIYLSEYYVRFFDIPLSETATLDDNKKVWVMFNSPQGQSWLHEDTLPWDFEQQACEQEFIAMTDEVDVWRSVEDLGQLSIKGKFAPADPADHTSIILALPTYKPYPGVSQQDMIAPRANQFTRVTVYPPLPISIETARTISAVTAAGQSQKTAAYGVPTRGWLKENLPLTLRPDGKALDYYGGARKGLYGLLGNEAVFKRTIWWRLFFPHGATTKQKCERMPEPYWQDVFSFP